MLVVVHQNGSGNPLVLVHGSGGGVADLAALARLLPRDRPIYSIAAQALDWGEHALTRIEDLAAHYLSEIERAGVASKLLLLGFSFGGILAEEMADQLSVRGRAPIYVGLLDSWTPSYGGLFSAGGWLRTARVAAYMGLIAANIAIPRPLRDTSDFHVAIGLRYQPRPSELPAILFIAAGERRTHAHGQHLGWEPIRPHLTVVEIPGMHQDLLGSYLETTAAAVAASLPRVNCDNESSEEFQD